MNFSMEAPELLTKIVSKHTHTKSALQSRLSRSKMASDAYAGSSPS